MKILVTNHHLREPGGTETWTYAMVAELKRQGHDVDVFTLHKGPMSERIANLGVSINQVKKEYDGILVNHNSCNKCLSDAETKATMRFFTMHGYVPNLEHVPDTGGVDIFVSVSEEVQQYWEPQGTDSFVIRNGVDCANRFTPTTINRTPKRILSLCQGKEANEMIQTACASQGWEFRSFSKNRNFMWEIENEIKWADAVVSLGRGVIEAMACGKPVVIWDSRDYNGNKADGLLTTKNWESLAHFNFSGRAKKMEWGPGDFVNALVGGYKPSLGTAMRKIALKHLNIKTQVQEYLDFI